MTTSSVFPTIFPATTTVSVKSDSQTTIITSHLTIFSTIETSQSVTDRKGTITQMLSKATGSVFEQDNLDSNSHTNVYIIIGVVVGVPLLMVLALPTVYCYRIKLKSEKSEISTSFKMRNKSNVCVTALPPSQNIYENTGSTNADEVVNELYVSADTSNNSDEILNQEVIYNKPGMIYNVLYTVNE